MRTRVAWLLVIVSLLVILATQLAYTAYPITSSICGFFGYQGACPIGTFTLSGVYLDHEYFGAGFVAAGLLSRMKYFQYGSILFGTALVATDLGDTFTQTVQGAASSFFICFLLLIAVDRAQFTKSDDVEGARDR